MAWLAIGCMERQLLRGRQLLHRRCVPSRSLSEGHNCLLITHPLLEGHTSLPLLVLGWCGLLLCSPSPSGILTGGGIKQESPCDGMVDVSR